MCLWADPSVGPRAKLSPGTPPSGVELSACCLLLVDDDSQPLGQERGCAGAGPATSLTIQLDLWRSGKNVIVVPIFVGPDLLPSSVVGSPARTPGERSCRRASLRHAATPRARVHDLRPPTPWSPPDTLYLALAAELPAGVQLVSTTVTAGSPWSFITSVGMPEPLSLTVTESSGWTRALRRRPARPAMASSTEVVDHLEDEVMEPRASPSSRCTSRVAGGPAPGPPDGDVFCRVSCFSH